MAVLAPFVLILPLLNGLTATPPPFAITFEFNIRYDEKPLQVKYVPSELYKKSVLLFLKVS